MSAFFGDFHDLESPESFLFYSKNKGACQIKRREYLFERFIDFGAK